MQCVQEASRFDECTAIPQILASSRCDAQAAPSQPVASSQAAATKPAFLENAAAPPTPSISIPAQPATPTVPPAAAKPITAPPKPPSTITAIAAPTLPPTAKVSTSRVSGNELRVRQQLRQRLRSGIS